MAFKHHFEKSHPTGRIAEQGELPPLKGEITEAKRRVSELGQVSTLPIRNQAMILDMVRIMMESANGCVGSWEAKHPQFWGLYMVGSRANSTNRPDSDVDLLSVGTFYYRQGFSSEWGIADGDVLEGFTVEVPEELPSEYNMGAVNRKYLRRATPQMAGALAVDLNVVDLTFTRGATLDSFKADMDLDEDGAPLHRLPLVELTVETTPQPSLHW